MMKRDKINKQALNTSKLTTEANLTYFIVS